MIDDQLEFARLHNRKVGGPGSLENVPSLDAGETPCVHDAGTVAHQSTDFGIFSVRKCCRDAMARRQIDQLNATAAEKRVTGDEKCIGRLSYKLGKDRIDVLPGLSVVEPDLQAHGPSRRLRVH